MCQQHQQHDPHIASWPLLVRQHWPGHASFLSIPLKSHIWQCLRSRISWYCLLHIFMKKVCVHFSSTPLVSSRASSMNWSYKSCFLSYWHINIPSGITSINVFPTTFWSLVAFCCYKNLFPFDVPTQHEPHIAIWPLLVRQHLPSGHASFLSIPHKSHNWQMTCIQAG